MSSQFVDINGDGHRDILVGSFSGVPQIIHGSPKGFAEPQTVKDTSGETVLIEAFWNFESRKWDSTDRAKSKGHCTSVAAVDWDDDGDLDLLLGDYYGGRLYLRENQGDSENPKFSATNQVVQAAGKPMTVSDGLAAPRIVDWNGDGLFDILCGGAKGGVYFYENKGPRKAPKFAAAVTLLAPVQDSSNSYVRRVPAKDGQPTSPGSSYHIEPVDFDGDGDLDLLVGARCSWLKAPQKKLTEAKQKEKEKVDRAFRDARQKLLDVSAKAKTNDERAALRKSDEYRTIVAEFQALARKQATFRSDPTETGDFVWLFRRR